MMNPIRIFISSVRSEFAKERQALYEYIRGDALLGQFFDPFLFEARPAENSKSQDVFLRAAEDCDIYVGLWGAQYGNAPKNGLSPTEMEYDAATKKHRYRIVFVKNLADGEVRDKREGSLIRKAERDVVRKKFGDYEELNPIYLAGYIERVGSGTTDIIKLCEECGLATPVFEDAGDFTVVLKRSKKSVVGGGQKDGQKDGQKSGQKQPDEMTSADKILNCIRENPSVTRNELVQIVGISSSAIQKHINNLKEKGSIRRIGGDRGGHWEVLD